MMEKRNSIIDCIRGVAMYLVILGHVLQYCTLKEADCFELPIFKMIYSFHMALFMLISGYLLYYSFEKSRSVLKLMKRTLSFLICIAIWSEGFYLFRVGFSNLTIEGIIASLSAYWFIWATLFSQLIVYVITLIPHKGIRYLVLILSCASTVLWSNQFTMTAWMYPYCVTGYVYADNRKTVEAFVKRYIKYIFLIAGLLWGLMFIWFDKDMMTYISGVNIFNSNFSVSTQLFYDVYRFILGLSGSVAIIGIIYLGLVKCRKMMCALEETGKYTLQFYLMQKFICEYGAQYTVMKAKDFLGFNPLMLNEYFYQLIAAPVFAALLIILIIIIHRIWMKNFTFLYSICFGKV